MQDPTGRLDILVWRIADRILEHCEKETGIPLRSLCMPAIVRWAERTFGTTPLWRTPLCSSEHYR